MGNVGASRYDNLFISQITLIDSPSNLFISQITLIDSPSLNFELKLSPAPSGVVSLAMLAPRASRRHATKGAMPKAGEAIANPIYYALELY